MRYRLDLHYDGTHFHGWQIQQNAPSVQHAIQEKLLVILGESIDLVGCGRTDKGVHASQYTAHFDCEKKFDPYRLIHQLNALLPNTIGIQACYEVDLDFHARFSAKTRSYQYFIESKKNVFARDYSWLHPVELDLTAIENACEILIKHTEFKAFCKGIPPLGRYNCKLHSARFTQKENGYIFEITANRFLRNMVRAIVGTMIQIGTNKMTLSEFENLLEHGTRADAGKSVPAAGLFLSKIEY